MNENLKKNREDGNKSYCLRNGLTIPWISFGTGVIWKYTRNKALFLKVNMKEILSSFKHHRLNRELKGNLQINKILSDAYNAGFRLFDTGRIYAYSETRIGKNVAFHPDVFIATKCSAMDITRKNSPDDVAGNLEISLKYLKRDKADLYLLHWPEGNWLDYYSQIIEQYEKGNCKAFGACNLKLTHLKEIERAGLELPLIIQTELHPFNGKEELREYCREHNIQLMAHTPTARSKEELLRNPILRSLMEKYNKSAVQIILRWHYQHDVIPVVSTFNKKHMIENHKIFDFLLTDSEMKEIDSLNQNLIVLDSTGIDDPNYIYNI